MHFIGYGFLVAYPIKSILRRNSPCYRVLGTPDGMGNVSRPMVCGLWFTAPMAWEFPGSSNPRAKMRNSR